MYGYEYLKKFLQSQNFNFEETEGLLKFPVSGVNYFAFKNDSPFLQVMLMVKAPDAPKLKVLELINLMNQSKFVSKFTLTDDAETIWCNYELIPNDSMDKDAWMIIFRVLDSGSDELIEKMQEL